MGAILIAVTVGVLIVDQQLGGWYPFLFLTVVTMARWLVSSCAN
jgi:hypothetical protein